MRTWTATTTTAAHARRGVLDVLTDPDAVAALGAGRLRARGARRRPRLRAGSRTRVSGRLAGRTRRLRRRASTRPTSAASRSPPTVRSRSTSPTSCAPTDGGTEVHASVSVRPGARPRRPPAGRGHRRAAERRRARHRDRPHRAARPPRAADSPLERRPDHDRHSTAARRGPRRRRGRRPDPPLWRRRAPPSHALRGVSLEVPRGQFTAVMGPSGSGKSTLMHLLAGLDTPDRGHASTSAARTSPRMSDKQLTRLRRKHIGFVFQSFNLLPTLTRRGERRCCRCAIAGRKPDRAAVDALIGARRPRRPPRPQARAALRRPAAARRRRPRAGRARRPCCSPTSRPATSTPPPAPRCSTLLRDAVDLDGQTTRDGHARPARGRRPPTASCSSPTAASSPTSPSPTEDAVLAAMHEATSR